MVCLDAPYRGWGKPDWYWKDIICQLYPNFPTHLDKAEAIILLFDNLIRDNRLDDLRLLLSSQRNDQLLNALKEMDMANMFKRLDYLFKVLEISSKNNAASDYPCFAKEFVEKCVQEIQEAMTLKQEEEGKEE